MAHILHNKCTLTPTAPIRQTPNVNKLRALNRFTETQTVGALSSLVFIKKQIDSKSTDLLDTAQYAGGANSVPFTMLERLAERK